MSEKNISFLLHIYNILEPYVNTGPEIINVKLKNKNYDTVRIKTVSLPSLIKYYIQFYKYEENKGKIIKILPINILEEMTPVVLAYMIMGDGNYNKEKRIIRIYTNSFTEIEVSKIVEVLHKKLEIKSRKQHDRKGQYIIIIEKEEVIKVREIVKPYIHPSMYKRIGLLSNTYKFNYKRIIEDI